MTFSQSIASCFVKYTHFDGRASRSEFWWFYLLLLLLSWGSVQPDSVYMGGYGIYTGIVLLVLFIPYLAVGVRRLHDTGKSGWRLLWVITIIGQIPVIIWFCTEGSKEINKYGDPIDLSHS